MPIPVFKNNLCLTALLAGVLMSCTSDPTEGVFLPDWSSRTTQVMANDSMRQVQTYLPVYAQIYQVSEKRKVDMTATISIRNTDPEDTVYLSHIGYYNTQGKLIRKYIDKMIYLKPMETIEIIINSKDNEGGTGANFLFDWYADKQMANPLFESVMVSTEGQQGISFTCRGVDRAIKK